MTNSTSNKNLLINCAVQGQTSFDLAEYCLDDADVRAVFDFAKQFKLPVASALSHAMLDLKNLSGDWIEGVNVSHESFEKITSEANRINRRIESQQRNGLAELNANYEQGLELNPATIFLNSLKSNTTRVVYRNALNLFSKQVAQCTLEDFPWAELRYYHITYLITALRGLKLSGARINTFLAVLKGVAKNARQLKQLSMDDYQSIYEVKSEVAKGDPKLRTISASEESQIVDWYDSDDSVSMIRDKAIFGLLIGCGLRRAEVCSLKADTENGINKASDVFHVQGKGDKRRLIVMPKWVQQAVNDWLDIRIISDTKPDEFLFVGVSHIDDLVLSFKIGKKAGLPKGLSGETISDIIKKPMRALGLDKFTPHDLRGTFATRMFQKNIDVNMIAKAMGHSNLNTTKIYDRRKEYELVDILRNMQA